MPERNGASRAVKLLSGVLALIFWAFVTGERPVERRVSVRIRLLNHAVGMMSTVVPPSVDAVIAGPWLPVTLLKPEELTMDLDLSGVGAGGAVFSGIEQFLRLPRDIKVIRMHPARIEVRLAKPGR